METKICTKCKVEKSITEFHNSKNRKGGKICYCKSCIREKNRENSQKNVERAKKWKENNKEKVIEWHKKCYENNKEKVIERAKKWKKKNRKKYIEGSKRYYQNNKERSKEYLRIIRKELPDVYISNILSANTNLSPEDIRQYPELIELKRTAILATRELNKLNK